MAWRTRSGLELGERARVLEHDVGGPLRLVGRPVVLHGRGLEDRVVQGVERLRDGVEGLRPIRGQLFVHQALGRLGVTQPGEAVVYALEVRAAPAPQLPSQPLATIEADLDVEREPGLQACAHETELRVHEVLVQMQALLWPPFEPALGAVLRAVILEAHAGFDGRQQTNQPSLDGLLGEQLFGELLLVRRTRLQMANRPIEPACFGVGGLLDPFAGTQHVVLEVEQSDSSALQEEEHAAVPNQGQQRAAEHQAVETGKHPGDERAVACYESLQRRPPREGVVWRLPCYPKRDAVASPAMKATEAFRCSASPN